MNVERKHWKIAGLLLAETVSVFGIYSVRAFSSLQKVIYGAPPPNLAASNRWLVLLVGAPAAFLIARVSAGAERPRAFAYAAGVVLSAVAGFIGLWWGFAFWQM